MDRKMNKIPPLTIMLAAKKRVSIKSRSSKYLEYDVRRGKTPALIRSDENANKDVPVYTENPKCQRIIADTVWLSMNYILELPCS
jgi:hypothetical protein